MCPIELRTKTSFRTFHILKINIIIPFCNLFIERPSYVHCATFWCHSCLSRSAACAFSHTSASLCRSFLPVPLEFVFGWSRPRLYPGSSHYSACWWSIRITWPCQCCLLCVSMFSIRTTVISQLPNKFHGHFATPLEYVIFLILQSLGCVCLLSHINLTLATL